MHARDFFSLRMLTRCIILLASCRTSIEQNTNRRIQTSGFRWQGYESDRELLLLRKGAFWMWTQPAEEYVRAYRHTLSDHIDRYASANGMRGCRLSSPSSTGTQSALHTDKHAHTKKCTHATHNTQDAILFKQSLKLHSSASCRVVVNVDRVDCVRRTQTYSLWGLCTILYEVCSASRIDDVLRARINTSTHTRIAQHAFGNRRRVRYGGECAVALEETRRQTCARMRFAFACALGCIDRIAGRKFTQSAVHIFASCTTRSTAAVHTPVSFFFECACCVISLLNLFAFSCLHICLCAKRTRAWFTCISDPKKV